MDGYVRVGLVCVYPDYGEEEKKNEEDCCSQL